MSYTKTQLNSASESDLVKIAEEFGLVVNRDTTPKVQIIDAILTAQKAEAKEEVVIEAAPAVKEPVPQSEQKKFRIILHNQDGVDASKFVKVQVNGIMYAIPREVEVEVPEIVVGALNDAIITRMDYENGKLVEKPGRRFPYTVLGEVK